MNKTSLLILVAFAMLFSACNSQKPDYKEQIETEISKGNFTIAKQMIDSVMGAISPEKKAGLEFVKDSLRRVELDFRRTKAEIVSWIEQNRGFTPSDSLLTEWEKSKALEFRIIDGEKRYFRNAVPNVFRVDTSARELSKIPAPKSDTPRDSLLIDALNSMTAVGEAGKFALPKKKMHVVYTLTVNADAVSDGKLLKVWLPYPRADVSRQSDIKLLKTSQPNYVLSGDKTAHTSIYMEQKARKGEPTVFWTEFEFSSRGEWFDLAKTPVTLYKKTDEYALYTAERKPHIVFSGRLKSLADSLTRDAKTPIENLQAIYRYIAANYPWASALEYSTIANIPEYVIENRKGDCGQVALLLITMLRYKGIPARWQSGWMVHPGEVNLHDWAEFYLENVGWIPIDISFARGGELKHPIGREFFMSGIDSYRLYVNSDYSGKFYPEKKFPRSETVDFQRGEVETDNGNLYFDQWEYDMKVEYLK